MKNLLIIYPHWVPSNLAGVHRPRLIANFLHDFGWHPILLTVSPDFYEEKADLDIVKTASPDIEVIHTKALKVGKPRIVGDIGLRGFIFLYKEALHILNSREIDFIWIPIPSFYTALLGRLLFRKTGVPYGIDYIDPWIRDISNRKNPRAVLSVLIAKILEPIAVKNASLISGVSSAYYEPVLQRNFKHRLVAHVGMPYGFDPKDHAIKLENIIYPWDKAGVVQPIVYAGAFLPNSHSFIKSLFRAVKELKENNMWDDRKRFYFLGTGSYLGTTIADYATKYGIADVVKEIRERFPYLHVLNFLASAYAVLVVGSTEKHYTASKTYQALLSLKPVLAVFHEESSAVTVMKECGADNLLVKYHEGMAEQELKALFTDKLTRLDAESLNWQPDLDKLDIYSAKASARALVEKLNEIV